MQGPITSWRRAIEQDGPGGAGKRRGADIADAPREPRAVRRDAGQRRVFLDPHVTHADRARGRPAGFELLGLVVAGRLNAEVVVAEALAEAFGEASHGDLATKTDLAVRTEIAELKTELKTEIAETKTDLLKWIIATVGFQTVVILGALISPIRIVAK
jgi:hypothetical protein